MVNVRTKARVKISGNVPNGKPKISGNFAVYVCSMYENDGLKVKPNPNYSNNKIIST